MSELTPNFEKANSQQGDRAEAINFSANNDAGRDFFRQDNANAATQTENLVSQGTLPKLDLIGDATGRGTPTAKEPAPLDGKPVLKPNPRKQHPTQDS